MKPYWDSGTRRFMVVVASTPSGTTAREATHAEIKALLDAAMQGWRDLLDAVKRAIELAP